MQDRSACNNIGNVLRETRNFLFERLYTEQHVSTTLKQTSYVSSSHQNEDKIHINMCPEWVAF
jgi:hypothetical protein